MQRSIRTGQGAWNRLRIVVHDQTLRGYVNDVLIHRLDVAHVVEGEMGFYVNAPGMAVVFRNLTVTAL